MQALFSMDLSNHVSVKQLDLYCKTFTSPSGVYPFFAELVQGVIRYMETIDSAIEWFSSNWKINRMAGVDRNILRIAVYEILYCDDIPTKVSINEAIDIGKKFGTKESGAFINGILDSIRIARDENKIQIES
ncbi:MAG: transcription antitermination factor NusB [Deltaproteobacteria bacterium]|nr:transcription antitermination factor NusB [Deltaproteobacteria bacterium]